MATFGDTRLPLRFWDKVIPHPATGCWEWQAAKDPNGYGRFNSRPTSTLAHRAAFIALLQPTVLPLDHLCRNRACCNPLHLEPVSHAENMARAVPAEGVANAQGRKTHCPAGHPYDETNTLTVGGKRLCRTCRVAATRAWRARWPR